MASPSEVQKFTMNAELKTELSEQAGELFIPTETPQAPKPSFISSLFKTNEKFDRDQLCKRNILNPRQSLLGFYVSGSSNVQNTVIGVQLPWVTLSWLNCQMLPCIIGAFFS